MVRGQFSEKSWKKFKKKVYKVLDEIKTKIIKQFGVHICIFQRTAGDQYQEGGGANLAPTPGPDRVKGLARARVKIVLVFNLPRIVSR